MKCNDSVLKFPTNILIAEGWVKKTDAEISVDIEVWKASNWGAQIGAVNTIIDLDPTIFTSVFGLSDDFIQNDINSINKPVSEDTNS